MGVVQGIHMRHVAVQAADPPPLELLKHHGIKINHQDLADHAAAADFVGLRLDLVKNGARFAKTAEKHDGAAILRVRDIVRSVRAGRKTQLDKQPAEPALDLVIVTDEICGQDRGDRKDKGKTGDQVGADLLQGQAQGRNHQRELAHLREIDRRNQARS